VPTSSLMSLAGAAGLVMAASPQSDATPWPEPEPVLPLVDRVVLLADALDALATYLGETSTDHPIGTLKASLDILLTVDFDPDSDELLSVSRRVDQLTDIVAQAVPLIRLAHLHSASTDPFRTRAAGVRRKLVAALVAAWREDAPRGAVAAMKDAVADVAKLADDIALWDTVCNHAGARFTELLKPAKEAQAFLVANRTKADPDHPALTIDPADPASATLMISYITCFNAANLGDDIRKPSGIPQLLVRQFEISTLWPTDQSGALRRMRWLMRRVAVHNMIMSALQTHAILQLVLPVIPDKVSTRDFWDENGETYQEASNPLRTNLNRYRVTLEALFTLLAKLHWRLAATADDVTTADDITTADAEWPEIDKTRSEFNALMGSPKFAADLAAAMARLEEQEFVEKIALAIGVAVAATVAGLVAAEIAGAVAVLCVGKATVLGVSWAAIAKFSADIVVVTLAGRELTEVAFGPPAEPAPFEEDLVWNVAGAAVGRVFGLIRAQVLRPKNLVAFRFSASLRQQVGSYVAQQIVMGGFVYAQERLRHNRSLGADELTASIVQQVVTDALLVLGRQSAVALKSTLLNAHPGIDRAAADAHDVRASQARALLDKVQARTATPQEKGNLPAEIEYLWKSGVALIESLPATSPERATLLATFAKARFTTELQLAILGLETSFSRSGDPSMFTPAGSRRVAFAPGMREFIDTHFGVSNVKPVPGRPTWLRATVTGGELIYFVEAPALAIRPAAPEVSAAAANAAVVATRSLDLARAGRDRLQEHFPSRLEQLNVLGVVGPKDVAGFLSLLAHPALATASAAEILALAASPVARRFTDLYPADFPGFAVRLLRLNQVVAFTPEVVSSMNKIERLIEGTPPALRPAVLAGLASDAALETWLASVPDLPLTPSDAQPATRRWNRLNEKLATYLNGRQPAVTYTTEQLNGLTDIDILLMRSLTREFAGLSEQEKRTKLDELMTLCAQNPLAQSSQDEKAMSLAGQLFTDGSAYVFHHGKRITSAQTDAVLIFGLETRDGQAIHTAPFLGRFDRQNIPMSTHLARLDLVIGAALQHIPAQHGIDLLIPWLPPASPARTAIIDRINNHPGKDLVSAVKTVDEPPIPIARRPPGTRLVHPVTLPPGQTLDLIIQDTLAQPSAQGVTRLTSAAYDSNLAAIRSPRKWDQLAVTGAAKRQPDPNLVALMVHLRAATGLSIEMFGRNVAVAKVTVNGEPVYLLRMNQGEGGAHSEEMIYGAMADLGRRPDGGTNTVVLVEMMSERMPCKGVCQPIINVRSAGKPIYFLSREFDSTARARALRSEVYGLPFTYDDYLRR
jgi:hypothetical protein